MSSFPQLSFACPIPWAEMHGDERERYCRTCARHVVNLSALTEEQRSALLAKVQAERTPLCVSYYRRISGEFVSAEKPLRPAESRAAVQFGVTALSAAALALVAQQAPAIGVAVQRAQHATSGAYVDLRDQAIASVRETLSTIGKRYGGTPHEPEPVIMLGGMICLPPPPVTVPAATVPAPAATATTARAQSGA